MTKRFALRTVLTVTTGRLLTKSKGESDNGIGDLYELLGWMTDDQPFTHQLPRFGKECDPWLREWFPELAKADDAVPRLDELMKLNGAGEGIERWLNELTDAGMPETFDIGRIPPKSHTAKNPIGELAEMMAR